MFCHLQVLFVVADDVLSVNLPASRVASLLFALIGRPVHYYNTFIVNLKT